MGRYAPEGTLAPNTPSAVTGLTVQEWADQLDCGLKWFQCLPLHDEESGVSVWVLTTDGGRWDTEMDSSYDFADFRSMLMANDDVADVVLA